jgi:hypothetical protein
MRRRTQLDRGNLAPTILGRHVQPGGAAAAAARSQALAGFQAVAGHVAHVQALKEMVLLPLVYPEVFQSMQVGTLLPCSARPLTVGGAAGGRDLLAPRPEAKGTGQPDWACGHPPASPGATLQIRLAQFAYDLLPQPDRCLVRLGIAWGSPRGCPKRGAPPAVNAAERVGGVASLKATQSVLGHTRRRVRKNRPRICTLGGSQSTTVDCASVPDGGSTRAVAGAGWCDRPHTYCACFFG